MSRLAVDKIVGANTESIVDFSSISNLKMPAGMIIQMQTATVDGDTSSGTPTSFTDQGLSVNITPKFATSKIEVRVNTCIGIGQQTNARIDYKCVENGSSTEVFRFDYVGASGLSALSTLALPISGHGFFQCSNTNQLTFKTQYVKANGESAQAGTIYPLWYVSTKHIITAMEIAQ